MSSSPQAPTRARTADADTRPSLTVLSGFWPAATFAVARALLAADTSLLLVRHDLTGIRDGVVRRVVRSGTGIVEDEQVALRHGCVSCTLREDVLPTLVRLARSHPNQDLVLMLPEVVEPEAVAAACAHCLVDGAPITDLLRVDSYVTVLDAEHLLDGLASTDDLTTLGIQAADDDHRALADVIVRQIEYADTLVLWGRSRDGEFDTSRLAVLLQRMAPWATHLRVDDDLVDAGALTRQLRHTHRHRPETPGVLARGLQGYTLGTHEPEPDCGVVSAVFRARRPFHPQRLHDVLEDVNAEMIRSRGHLWLASQPDTVIAWEFAGGGLAMGSLGHWLVSLPEDRWEHVEDQRRLAAALDWDPYYGDRHQHLVFIGLDADPVDLHRILAGCLLTDAELADGEEIWRTYPDPFTGCFPLVAEELTDTDTEGARPA
ncbi:GTP-binding protein [Verrucosispora sp. WMMA2044]|uniref:Cobalamin biosynthesis protein CobW n=1 Tax=Verrucosispora sioxanthis TaxID=2499994 RepID=A0A6M1LCA8_9ACTN|nr:MULTISPECIES: GTP-binding protein [Micromonospora]NEE66742.1 cobalamin biosynthesis protein CobW [Verrucosispora sioxanthis]NGM15852.1 cobalamin biosynthesis protein CobW [Verrucosispora sioxanthis]WBB48526.1 GTP-binding protein [Verrucosispora sp. WMMA2044]